MATKKEISEKEISNDIEELDLENETSEELEVQPVIQERMMFGNYRNEELQTLVRSQKSSNMFNFVTPNASFWTKRIFRLILETLLITWAVFTIVFVLMNLPYMLGIKEMMPSGIVEKLAHATEAEQEALTASLMGQLHLDHGYLNQYAYSIKGLFDGSFGTSWDTLLPVSSDLLKRLSVSVTIGFIGVTLSLLIGIPTGIFLARRQNIYSDLLASIMSVIAFSIPSFVVALLIVLINSTIGLPFVFSYGNVFMFLLAGLAISIPVGFGYTRYLRTSVRQEYSEQYVSLARVKGVSEEKILRSHILKPALFPIINYLPFVVVGAFFGSITIETVFAIPGTGQMLIQAALSGDQPTVLAITTLYTFFTVISFFVRDLLITFVDPRIKGE